MLTQRQARRATRPPAATTRGPCPCLGSGCRVSTGTAPLTTETPATRPTLSENRVSAPRQAGGHHAPLEPHQPLLDLHSPCSQAVSPEALPLLFQLPAPPREPSSLEVPRPTSACVVPSFLRALSAHGHPFHAATRAAGDTLSAPLGTVNSTAASASACMPHSHTHSPPGTVTPTPHPASLPGPATPTLLLF